VKHDRLAIGAEPDVELDRGDAELDRTAKPGERVLLVEARHAAMPDHDRLGLPREKRIAAEHDRTMAAFERDGSSEFLPT
jgi:hypothetical protein